MRVIAGTARGTKLKTPKGMQVRPTADRVKEALFSILGPRIPGAFFIDLYAGSGAIGIEALSRGAEFCIFVDNQRESISLINDNLAKTHLADLARIIYCDVLKCLERLALEQIKADLVFLDPPYNFEDLATLVNLILATGLISDQGLIIVEHAIANLKWAESFTTLKQRSYGDSCLTFIKGTL